MTSTHSPTQDLQSRRLRGCVGTFTVRVKHGDTWPSQHTVQWSEQVTKRCHFKEFQTFPQQDLKPDRTGITINKAIDRRAQPWEQVIRANIHGHPANTLPPKTASVQEVKEWIYLVLTQRKFADWVDCFPQNVCVTLLTWNRDGTNLRRMSYYRAWDRVCPMEYTNVDKEVVRIGEADRMKVSFALSSTIVPLLLAEEKAEMRAEKKAKKKAEQAAKALAKHYRNEDKMLRPSKLSWVKGMLCFGGKPAKELEAEKERIFAYSSTTLPEYSEKEVLIDQQVALNQCIYGIVG